MIYQQNNNLRTNDPRLFGRGRQEPRTKQAGVTLLLAVLVLASILAISFSMATILLVEVRTSGDLLRTEPAFYAAQAITEEVIFKVKRKIPSNQITYTSQIGVVNLNNPAPVETSTTTPAFQIKVAPGTTFITTSNRYALYNPSVQDPTAGSNYGKIRLTYLTTGNSDALTVYICQFDPSDPPDTYTNPPACSNTIADAYWPGSDYRGFPLKPSNSPREWLLDPAKQQEIILFNSGSTGNIHVQIEGFGPSPSYTPKGIPYADETAVDINANNSGVNRKIRVIVPKN